MNWSKNVPLQRLLTDKGQTLTDCYGHDTGISPQESEDFKKRTGIPFVF